MKTWKRIGLALGLITLLLFPLTALSAPTVGQVRAQCESAVRHDAIIVMIQRQEGVPVEEVVASFTAAAQENKVPEAIQRAAVKMIRAIYAGDNAAASAAYREVIDSCTAIFAPKIKL